MDRDKVYADRKEILGVEEVAEYLGVGPVTVYRWCREGRLPCLKIGKFWRIRRQALEDFLSRRERPGSLVGQLQSFLVVPDNIIGIAQTTDLLHRLDAAFLKVGEARGGLLVKFHGGEPETTEDELRTILERNGLDASRLEGEGRFRFVAETDPVNGRTDALERLVAEEAEVGRTIWASFDWTEQVNLDVALRQQEALKELADARQLVVKTGVVEEAATGWPVAELRRAQMVHSGTIWIAEAGISLSRVTTPRPAG
ncbi:MAG TPA: helix-turn-helix domain-containing protein [Rubrobacter sp.]|nr:helix-turn-helix domain-containing protein [Rubrobacter sp.]